MVSVGHCLWPRYDHYILNDLEGFLPRWVSLVAGHAACDSITQKSNQKISDPFRGTECSDFQVLPWGTLGSWYPNLLFLCCKWAKLEPYTTKSEKETCRKHFVPHVPLKAIRDNKQLSAMLFVFGIYSFSYVCCFVLLSQVFLMFLFFAKCPVNFIFVLSKLADTLEELRQMTARGGKKLRQLYKP